MYISEITENGKITATKDNGYTVSYSLEKELFESIKNSINQIKSKEELKQEVVDEYIKEKADEDISEYVTLLKKWEDISTFKVDDVFRYKKKAYRVIQDHEKQLHYLPDATPSLYEDLSKKIVNDDGSYPIWQQPLGTHDAYKLGDKVQHNNKNWESTVDVNTWEPGVYGWKEID